MDIVGRWRVLHGGDKGITEVEWEMRVLWNRSIGGTRTTMSLRK